MLFKKKKEGETVLPGERDEEGKLKTPHTRYGVVSNIRYIIKAIWDYKKSIIFLMCIGAVTQPCMQYIWGFFTKHIIDIVQAQAGTGAVDPKPLIKAILIITVINIVLRLVNTNISNRNWPGFIDVRFNLIGYRVDKFLSMRYEVLEQPHILDMARKASEATGGNTNGVEGLMHNMESMSQFVVTLIVSFFMIIGLDLRLIIILMIIGFINFLSYRKALLYDKKHVWDEMPENWRKQDYMQRCTQDFDYAKDIRLFDMKDWLISKQHTTFMEYYIRYIKGRKIWLLNSGVNFTTGIVQATFMYMILVNGVLRASNPLTIGDFTLFITLCGAFSSALSSFLNNLGTIERNSMQIDDYRTFIDYKVESTAGIHIDPASKLTFEFKNVSYKYPGSENYALKNLSIKIPWGQKLAVVGLNGAGKSTFIKLLLRLYDATEGEILLNGINIKEYDLNDYFALFAPLFQNVEIFAFPLSENVSMKESEETDKERVEQMLDKSGLGEKIKSLDKGIDTELLKIISDDGIDLSGGEKQKLALARALYKNAPVLVLDEPTAALDALAEYKLYKNFDSMIGDKSAVYISHRLSSTRFCDKVAMFMNGKLVEYGTHEGLMAKNGDYAKMYSVQSQYYENTVDEETDNGEGVYQGA